jgi:hypothetical protein
MIGYEIIKQAPPGTQWRLERRRRQWHGVAARWSDAASPVWVFHPTGEWEMTTWRVADFAGPNAAEAALQRVRQEEGVQAHA